MRHKWTDNKCERCGMARERIDVRKRAGNYGRRWYKSTVYRHRRGYECNCDGKVPPCLPPAEAVT